MTIESKIAEIRKKPEHVRMAYVVVFVTIAMTFVIILWVFSLRVRLAQTVEDMRHASQLPADASQQVRSITQALSDSVRGAQEQVNVVNAAITDAAGDGAVAAPQAENGVAADRTQDRVGDDVVLDQDVVGLE